MLSFHKDGSKFCLAQFYHSVLLNQFVEQEDTAVCTVKHVWRDPGKLDPQFVDVTMEKMVLCPNKQFRDPVQVTGGITEHHSRIECMVSILFTVWCKFFMT